MRFPTIVRDFSFFFRYFTLNVPENASTNLYARFITYEWRVAGRPCDSMAPRYVKYKNEYRLRVEPYRICVNKNRRKNVNATYLSILIALTEIDKK